MTLPNAMIYFSGLSNPTRMIGLAAYLFAAMLCAIAWTRRIGTARPPKLAASLAILNAGLFIDIWMEGRWRLHDLLQAEAITRNLYSQRTGPQFVVLGMLGATAMTGMMLASTRPRGRPGASVAACGAILALSCWCAEVISLHTVDAVLYHTVKGVMLVTLIWTISSLTMGLGIQWDARAACALDRD